MVIYGKNVFVDGKLQPKYLVINDGEIIDCLDNYSGEVLRYEDKIISPGFIDTHYHGNYGNQFIDCDSSQIHQITKNALKEGITSLLATTTTQKLEMIERCVKTCGDYISSDNTDCAQIVGIHLEGPFLNEIFSGSQDKSSLQPCDLKMMNQLNALSSNCIKKVTYACEFDNNFQFQDYLTLNNIIGSIGHSDANYTQCIEAVKHGASCVTHLYNGMSSFHHRNPNVVGAALSNENLYVELTVDNIHLHPVASKIAYQCKGKDKIILVSDSSAVKGLPMGKYTFANKEVYVNHLQEVRTIKTNSLAGSGVPFNKCIKNFAEVISSIEDALYCATYTSAKLLKIEKKKGQFVKGADADFVITDFDLNIHEVFIKGERVL